MKKYLLMCCAAFALVGCSPNEGGTGSSSDQNAGSGTSSSVTSTNRGIATSPGGSSTNQSSSAVPDNNTPSSKP